MMRALSGTGVVQICFVVENLEQAVANWVANLGAGPFFVHRDLRVPVEHRGTPSELHIHVALGQSGEVQVELIEVAAKHPSVYTDMFPNGGGGFHHVAIFVDDFAEQLAAYEAEGCPIGAIGQFNGAGFAYVDTRSKIGFFTELYEENPKMRHFYANIAAAAEGWDGGSPVRSFADVTP